jgi:hypothetical protein
VYSSFFSTKKPMPTAKVDNLGAPDIQEAAPSVLSGKIESNWRDKGTNLSHISFRLLPRDLSKELRFM